ncbi:SH3 domain-containing protein [Pseudomonas aeruginosa]|uniref:SH3 domain-containing protein n=2 Tax=Gammaproteobacteria TaxID=1236 RepID=UPI00037F6840|nr:SH3 domain-containing protein [Pseudomonas aeruginosa]EIU3316479.1 hypothetical protein [Pseudomonas aeruginosa]EIY2512130.1 hypothetical protein [Pseudomonas aeruginosa]EIY2820302.1 hypothetical protein [Pseudomonas aeruginosa]EKT8668860.1 hypothetical protein [Pseudomonas aeruginosa]EKU2957353.1 hypothetical protein [Pseudomonas aeruginosa]
MQRKAIVPLIAMLVGLSGCANEWQRLGATAQDLSKDRLECDSLARTGLSSVYAHAPQYGASGSKKAGMAIGASLDRQQMFADCMVSRGWSRAGEPAEQASADKPFVRYALNLKTSPVEVVRVDQVPQWLYAAPIERSPVVLQIKQPTYFSVLAETDDMYRVRSARGDLGWIKKSHAKTSASVIFN